MTTGTTWHRAKPAKANGAEESPRPFSDRYREVFGIKYTSSPRDWRSCPYRTSVPENLRNHIVSERGFALSGFQDHFVKADGATLALFVVAQDHIAARVVRRIMPAAAHLVASLELGHRRVAELKLSSSDHIDVAQLVAGMLQQFIGAEAMILSQANITSFGCCAI